MRSNIQNSEQIIQVINLHKSFQDMQVLKGISFVLNKGETLVILGKSGTGKSVTIKCLVRLILPDAGSINVLDHDVLSLEEDELNRLRIRVGYLFQEGALYDSMSLVENVMFPLKRNQPRMKESEMKDRAVATLESVGLADAQEKMPSELSGGMRKRGGLARTLILNPEIILYDEPTTGLDPYTAQDIDELIIKIQETYHTTSIVVTHDMKCARLVSDRIIVLHDGQVLARGTFQELIKHEDETVRNYFA
jgi:phospholipid/cholesterol/gamma-HCH transport system ATP-binding protein